MAINVRDHGIISGKKKDAPANTESLVRLIKSLGGRGGMLYFPDGTYWLNPIGSHLLDRADTTYVSWLGDGIKASRIINADPHNGCLFDWTGLNVFDVSFEKIGFYRGVPGVMMFSGGRQYRIAIRDCSFRDGRNGLLIEGGQWYTLDNVLCFRNENIGLSLGGTLNVCGTVNVEQNGHCGVHILADGSGSRRTLPSAIHFTSLVTERNGTDLMIEDGMWGIEVDNIHPRSKVYFGPGVHACNVSGNDIYVEFAATSYSNQAIGHYIRASGNLVSNHTGPIPGVPWRPDYVGPNIPPTERILDKDTPRWESKHNVYGGDKYRVEFHAANLGAGSHRLRVVLQTRAPVRWYDFLAHEWIDNPTSAVVDITRTCETYSFPVRMPDEDIEHAWLTIYLDAAGNGLERMLIADPRVV